MDSANQNRGTGGSSRKYLKGVTAYDCKVASYKVAKARNEKKVDLYFREHRITERVLRGERFFLSELEKVKFDNQKPPPRTPPGFRLVIQNPAKSPISFDKESSLGNEVVVNTSLPQHPHEEQSPLNISTDNSRSASQRDFLSSSLVNLCPPDTTGGIGHIDNSSWMPSSFGVESELDFGHLPNIDRRLSTQGLTCDAVVGAPASSVNFRDHMTDSNPTLDHQIDMLESHGPVSAMDGLQLYLPMPNENTASYLLDQLAEHHERDVRVKDEGGFAPIVDVLFANWTSYSPILNTRDIHALYSYFRPFILESRDGELLEGVSNILGSLPGGLLQFLSYAINLLSNNLLSETDIDRLAQWIDDIQGYKLLAKLLSLKASTIQAFASNLLPGALRLKNASLLHTLLNAGINPDLPIDYNKILPLQHVSHFGTTELAQLLLHFGADVNAPPPRPHRTSKYGYRTALQAAAENGNIELVQILLEAGADVNAPPIECETYRSFDRGGRTPLQAAAQNGNTVLVQLLLEAGADVNAPPAKYGGRTAFQAATESGNIKLAKILLKAGADVNAPPAIINGRTALQGAVRNGNIELVQLLLKAGADVNASPIERWIHRSFEGGGRTALQAAAARGNIELVQLLLEAGADVNAPSAEYGGHTAFQTAAENGNIELVQLLLEAGADVNAPPAEYYGHTALQAAAENGNIELVKILLEAGADVNAFPAEHNYEGTALQAAAGRGNIELVQLLLEAGADVNAPPAEDAGRTAFQAAAERGNIKLVQLLLEAGTDINAPPTKYDGRTAFQTAAENGNIELIQLLLEAGADVNAPPAEYYGRTALQAAAENGNIELVEVLLNAGATVDAPPSSEMGVTAIQAAAIRGRIRITQLLLDANADMNAAPAAHDGRTALEGAAEHGRIDMLQLLLNAGARTRGDCQSQYLRAVKFAETEGHLAAAEVLRNHRPWTDEDRQIFDDIVLSPN
ncbi:hypothetical protein DL770_006279 [Monosporascus sp. CRB-9-2]|nr:hypothetical protein DL770_006279 [Monosporascus sp. CRB-9-2]